MSRKRANGEGSIFQRSDGRWCATFSLGYNAEGKMEKKTLYGKTQKEAREKLERFKNEYNLNHGTIDDKTTVQDWFYTFMYDYKQKKVKPSTFARYEGIYRLYIKNTTLGKTTLKKLNLTIIQRYYNNLIDDDKNSTLIKTINSYLKPCLEEAFKQDYIPKNYAKLIDFPKTHTENKLEILTVKQQEQFIDAIKGHALEILFLTALGTGLREGELLGLHWDDIDFDKSIVSVKRSLKRVPDIDRDGNKIYKTIEQEPKTVNAYRDVPILN